MRVALYHTLSYRFLQQRWSRAVMVAASIALGVATLVATRALNMSMSAAAQIASRPMTGVADLHVTNGDAGVSKDLVSILAQVPGIRAVLPLIIERVVIPELNNRTALLIGIEMSLNNLSENPWGIVYHVTNPLQVWQSGRQTSFVGEDLARDLQQSLPLDAKHFKILAAGRSIDLPVWVGTVEAHGPAASLGGNVIYMEATTAQTLLHRQHLLTRIDLMLAENTDADSVRARVTEVLDGRALVRTPEALDKTIDDALSGLQIGFSVCGAGALVIGLFLVYNALAVSVTERRHEIGILRSLGATRGQIWALFVGEAAMLGFVGACFGVPLGIGLAHVGLGPMQSVFRDLFLALDAREVVLTNGTVAFAFAAGICTAIVAALVPAVKASHEEPATAVRRIPPHAGLSHQILQLCFSLILMIAGLTCMLMRAALPPRVGTHGCLVLVLLGFLLMTPLIAAILARLIQPFARVMLSIEGRLAADNLVRAPGRTGLVITALAAGVAMVLQTAGVICSNENVILRWIDQSIKADLFVTSGSPVSGSGQNLPMSEQIGKQLAEFEPEIECILPVRFRKVDFQGHEVFLVALDAMKFSQSSEQRGSAPRQELYPRLTEPGIPGVIVSDNFAALYKVNEGDVFSIRGPHGNVPLRMLGAVEDYSWNLGTVIIDRAVYQKHFEDPLVDVFDVFLKQGANDSHVRERLLRRFEPESALVVLTRDELKDRIQSIIHRLYHIAYSQEIVVGIVAALGVVTALMISVMQRRSELGILRAIGATQGQILKSVLAEAALMGVIGAAIGMLVGVPIEWYILQVILFEEAGFRFPVYVPWIEAGVIALLALLTATLAGLGPALQTLRLRIPEAIAYE